MRVKSIKTLLATIFLLSVIPTFSAKAATISYTVKSGDSLWKISQAYKTTVSSIVTLNNFSANSYIYPGQTLLVENNNVSTTNYRVVIGDNLWTIAQKYGTTMDTIIKSNMLSSDVIMPGQILTVPINSTQIVKPVGITMMRAKAGDRFGDLYTWDNARRLFTVDTKGTLVDLKTGISFNIKYYGGSNHADIIPLTTTDTAKMKQIYPTWSWSFMRPMVLQFTQGGQAYHLAVSVTGMPHSTTNILNNGISGHFDMYFYNSTSHVNNELSPTHQANVLKANGQ